MEENVIGKLVRKSSRVVISSEIARNLADQAIMSRIRDSWTWENRNHRSLLRALRPALRHMRFHLFKANGGEIFVSPVPPKALDPAQSIDHIKEELEYLSQNPGSTREKMVEALRPGADSDSQKVAEVVQPLRWLIERGHVIEFFDGTLALPTLPGKRAIPDQAAEQPSQAKPPAKKKKDTAAATEKKPDESASEKTEPAAEVTSESEPSEKKPEDAAAATEEKPDESASEKTEPAAEVTSESEPPEKKPEDTAAATEEKPDESASEKTEPPSPTDESSQQDSSPNEEASETKDPPAETPQA